jgi:hypothetical protein
LEVCKDKGAEGKDTDRIVQKKDNDESSKKIEDEVSGKLQRYKILIK